ncbi:hypothetical protein WHR41_01468 [Cladosporium halotolerans]|uniref:histone acetyltransferase n=1 Tax=Cladosporium halotolerans TaxID=1052096 RepID=A0AB34KX94_9PEZI
MAAMNGDFGSKGQNCERLQDAFNAFLPKNFQCQIRYTHTPPKSSEPLFSPRPGAQPEKTKLASHFLTVSVPVNDKIPGSDQLKSSAEDHVVVFAMEVLVYSSRGLVTMFVSKADSTGYLPLRRPSPIKSVATTFLWWLSTQQRQSTKSTGTKLVISLFARAQSQYLFPGSADHGKKHVLDDRQLIRWWARVLDPLFLEGDRTDQDLDLQGYMTVPGYHGIETKSFFPTKPNSSEKSRNWTPGNPLIELAQARDLPETTPTRCLLPRFPDDPKARFMQDLDDEVGLVEDAGSLALTSPSKQKSGRWKTINDLERFWEAMEFRQECSSGRVVGFLWLVVRPPASERHLLPSQDDRESSPSRQPTTASNSQTSTTSRTSRKSTSRSPKRAKKLSGPVIPRQPRLKGSSSTLSATSDADDTSKRDGPYLTKEGYDSAMQILLNLEFNTLAAAVHSTSKWVAEVSRMAGLKAGEWALECVGTAETETAVGAEGAKQMNDLGGLVRKKRKADDGGSGAGATPVESADQAKPEGNGVNVLVGRKKAKN